MQVIASGILPEAKDARLIGEIFALFLADNYYLLLVGDNKDIGNFCKLLCSLKVYDYFFSTYS